MNGLVLFGAGSPICADVVETCRRNGQPIAAAIRNVPGPVHAGDGVDILDADALPPQISSLSFLLPLFDPNNRRTALAAANDLGFRHPARLVDCTAIVAASSRIEAGTYVNAGCILASGVVLGEFAFCNRGANIGHDCRVGAFVSIGPGAILSGNVTIGNASQIGAGAIILPKVTIGAGALVAPGAVVSRDMPDGSFAAGNPARITMRRPTGV